MDSGELEATLKRSRLVTHIRVDTGIPALHGECLCTFASQATNLADDKASLLKAVEEAPDLRNGNLLIVTRHVVEALLQHPKSIPTSLFHNVFLVYGQVPLLQIKSGPLWETLATESERLVEAKTFVPTWSSSTKAKFIFPEKAELARLDKEIVTAKMRNCTIFVHRDSSGTDSTTGERLTTFGFIAGLGAVVWETLLRQLCIRRSRL